MVTLQRVVVTVKIFMDKLEDLVVEAEVTSVGVEAEVGVVEDLPIFTRNLTGTNTKYICNSNILLQALRMQQMQIMHSQARKMELIRSPKLRFKSISTGEVLTRSVHVVVYGQNNVRECHCQCR